MKKFIGDSLVWLSILFGVLTVSWCWSWNWFLAIIFGLFVFVFLCNLGATLSPPEQQEKTDVNSKQESELKELKVVENKKSEFEVTFEVTMCKIEKLVGKVAKDYVRLDELNKELGYLQELNPRSNAMSIKIAEEIVVKAEELQQLMERMETDVKQIKTLFENNKDDIAKVEPRLVVHFNDFLESNRDVFSTANKLRIEDIIYYYKEFLN